MKKNNLIVGVSGGKDSTAVCLYLKEQGYSSKDYIRVFLDTGWEAPETYQYLDYLESVIGPIKRIKANIKIKKYHDEIKYFEKKIGYESPMIRMIFKKINFPRNFMRWCTSELKLKVLKNYLDELDFDPTNTVGIRKEESLKRSKMTEYEWSDYLNCYTWRPIIDWTEKDVISIHKKYNVIPNKLYLNGSNRVGCFPCIHSRKKDISFLPKERVELIHELETVINKIRQQNKKLPCGFFTHRDQSLISIYDFIKWSKTSYGGKQYMLFDTTEPSCVKWGLCEYEGTK